MLYVQATPACAIVAARPAIVSVPCLAEAAGFGAAEKWTCPWPLPLAAPTIPIHASVVVAVHAQASAIATATSPVPPLAGTVCDGGVSVASHEGGDGGPGGGAGACSCEMPIVRPA